MAFINKLFKIVLISAGMAHATYERIMFDMTERGREVTSMLPSGIRHVGQVSYA